MDVLEVGHLQISTFHHNFISMSLSLFSFWDIFDIQQPTDNFVITTCTHRSGRLPGACVFSHEKALLFHGPPRSLRRVVAANECETSHEANFVSYAWRGAITSVPSIPARRLEPRMKHVRFCGNMFRYFVEDQIMPQNIRMKHCFSDLGIYINKHPLKFVKPMNQSQNKSLINHKYQSIQIHKHA